MTGKDKSSVLVSIFKRKGGEGILTQLVNDNNKSKFEKLFVFLNEGENGIIVHFEDELNWFFLTNIRIILNEKGVLSYILNSELIEVYPALQEEFKKGGSAKQNFTQLHLRSKDDKDYIIKVEKGEPYQGMYQVLHYIASGNKFIK